MRQAALLQIPPSGRNTRHDVNQTINQSKSFFPDSE
jgi:hypothetical protein